MTAGLAELPPPAPETRAYPPPPPAASAKRRRRLLPATVAVLLVAAAGIALWFTVLAPGDETAKSRPAIEGPDGAPFTLEYPSSWKPLTREQRKSLPGEPLAVLRRTDGHGTIVVTKRPPVTTPLEQLPRGLKRTLSRRFPDFREVGAKLVTLDGTRALVYTFARTKSGTAQSLVVVPSGDHSFTLNAVVPPRSPDAAREVGAIIASFDPDGD